MAKITLIIASLTASFTYVLAADIVLSRSFPSCGYVGGQIYCSGGDTSPSLTSDNSIDTTLYSLNISNFDGKSSDSMSNQWNKVVPASPFQTENRRTPTSIVLSDGKRFLIQGGHNMYGNKLSNQSIIYDTSSNTWSKARSYAIAGVGTKQIYYSTAVNLPDDLVGFYGGLEQVANISAPEIAENGIAMPFDANNGSYVGFSHLTMLTSGSGIWSSFSPQSKTLADFYPNSQTATINPITGKIYYLGGSYYTTSSNGNPARVPFNWAAVFSTKSGTWSNETLNGVVPTDRIYHTANLLPNSQELILYGGSDNGLVASTDYCFTLNLETNTWTKQDNVNVPSYLSGPRFSHSAVLVDSTLFILFGRGLDGTLNPSLLTIDVTSISNIVYTATYIASAISNTPNNTTNNTIPNSKESSGLSKGAIGGIAAGSIVAGLGIIAFILFYLRRQKKENQRKLVKDDIDEHMNVDWDKIEDHYKEVPITVSNSPVTVSNYPITVSNSPTTVTNSPTTVTNSPQFTEPTKVAANSISSTNIRHYSPNLIETSVASDADFSYLSNKNPDTKIDIVKPSVSSTDDYVTVKPDAA
ncbi:hypothetical protein BDF21DRAFT_490689 [Thamnidium elegans]|uniref:Galactose oxidase n=1 Tax=Thamnidium elegans TaxID=101142 RepID=A0A8H7VRC3_9FUNG|nr:hypothetical protein INT48_002095 [Thamnidium elegans]KAI8092037.1 hypothetical protein BDF21DRAFT_490689 [Thamnidium elegans]